MAADIIKVDTVKLESDSDEINGLIKDLNQQMQGLERSISDLNQMWEGEAYQAFKTAVEDDLSELRSILDNLTKVYQYEQNAKTSYDACEKQVGQLVESITIKGV